MNRLLLTSLITAAFVAVAGPALAADGSSSGGGNGSAGSSSTSGNSGGTNPNSGGNSGNEASGVSGSSGSYSDTSASADQDIYGSEIMTPAERAEFRSKMQSANSSQERESLRVDHQAAMQSRAKQRGITLPDDAASQSPGASSTP